MINWINGNKTNHAIRWIVIYPADSVIRPLNNLGHQKIAPQAKSGNYFQIWFSPDLGGGGGGMGNGGVLSMRMQVIMDSSFARSGSAPIWGGKKGEFRDWTSHIYL